MSESVCKSTLEDVIGEAEEALRPDATYELRDIDVHEVSIVDRAANKRRFLIVKSHQGEAAMADENKTEGLTLTSAASKAAADALTTIVGTLVKTANEIKEATIDDEGGASVLPGSLLEDAKVASSALSKMLIANTVEKGVSETASALLAISEGALSAATAIATDGEMSDETKEVVTNMAKALNAVVKGDEPEEDPAPAADPEPSETNKDEGEGEPSEEPPAAPALDPNIAAIAQSVAQLTETVAGLAKQSAAAQPKDEESAVAKATAELKKSLDSTRADLDTLQAKLDRADEDAPAGNGGGAGSAEPVAKADLWPSDFNKDD